MLQKIFYITFYTEFYFIGFSDMSLFRSCWFWLICASAACGQSLEFFPTGYTQENMTRFRQSHETQLFADEKPQRLNCTNFWDIRGNSPVSLTQNASGYEHLLCIQHQIELEFLIHDKESDGNIKTLKEQQEELIRKLTFNNMLSDSPFRSYGDFPNLCAVINDHLDPELNQLQEENFKHRGKGAMIDPLFEITGISGYLLTRLIEVQSDRVKCQGELGISTPRAFGHLANVDSLQDPTTTNLGYKVLRGLLRSIYGDGCFWAALKLGKELIMESLAMSDFDAACRYAAFVQFIQDKGSRADASTQKYPQTYYDRFWRELAAVITSTAVAMQTPQELNYWYNCLDENTGSNLDRRFKEKMNKYLKLASRCQQEYKVSNYGEIVNLLPGIISKKKSNETLNPVEEYGFENPQFYSDLELYECFPNFEKIQQDEKQLDELKQKLKEARPKLFGENSLPKGQERTQLLQDFRKNYGECVRLEKEQENLMNELAGQLRNPDQFCNLQKLQSLLQEAPGQTSQIKKSLAVFLGGLLSKDQDERAKDEAEDMALDFIQLYRFNKALYDECAVLPSASWFVERDGTSDGVYFGSCYWCATAISKPFIGNGRMRHYFRNCAILSGDSQTDVDACVMEPGRGILSSSWMSYPGTSFLVYGNVCQPLVVTNSLTHDDNFKPICGIFNKQFTVNGRPVTVNFPDFQRTGCILDKLDLQEFKPHPLHPLRVFYNSAETHFYGLAIKCTDTTVAQLAGSPRRRLMMRIRNQADQTPALFYKMYWTPFTGGFLDDNGQWVELIPVQPWNDKDQWRKRFIPKEQVMG